MIRFLVMAATVVATVWAVEIAVVLVAWRRWRRQPLATVHQIRPGADVNGENSMITPDSTEQASS